MLCVRLGGLIFGGDSAFVLATLTSSGRHSPTMAPRGWYARLCSGFYFQLFIIAKRQKVAMAPTSTSRSELSGRWDRITGHGREATIVQSPAEFWPAVQEWLQDKTTGQRHRRPSLSLSPCKMRNPAQQLLLVLDNSWAQVPTCQNRACPIEIIIAMPLFH